MEDKSDNRKKKSEAIVWPLSEAERERLRREGKGKAARATVSGRGSVETSEAANHEGGQHESVKTHQERETARRERKGRVDLFV